MNALIAPQQKAFKVINWVLNGNIYKSVSEIIPNSARVCQVEETPFEVALPLFWVECDDEVVADKYYYDTVDETINEIINAPHPAPV